MTNYTLPHVKPWVVAAADEVGTRFGLKSVGGWRAQDPFPDHPSGLAIDFTLNDRGKSDHATGQAIADYLQANAKRLGVKYLIWDKKSWNPQRNTWAKYTATDNPHEDHVHATFLPAAPAGGPIVGTGTGTIEPASDLVGAVQQGADAMRSAAAGINAVGDLAKKALWLSLPSSQIRMVAGVMGVAAIFTGVIILGRQVKG